jgi:hypothetical protein
VVSRTGPAADFARQPVTPSAAEPLTTNSSGAVDSTAIEFLANPIAVEASAGTEVIHKLTAIAAAILPDARTRRMLAAIGEFRTSTTG